MTGAGLADLVAKAFEAACDADGMAEFLSGVADFFGAQQAAIVIAPQDNPSDILSITFGIRSEQVCEWFATHEEPDFLFDKFRNLRPNDAVMENNRNHDPDHWSMRLLGDVVSIDNNNICFMALWREVGRPPFSDPEVETLRSLIGYFRRAIEVNKRFVNIFSEHRNALSVLDQLPRAVIILGQNGQPIYQNLEATRILNKNDGLTLSGSQIKIDDDDTSNKISTFLDQVRTPKSDQFNSHRLITVIPRKSGIAPYKLIMYALPFQRSQAIINENQGLAVILIYDSETLINLNTSLLHNFYNLTRAEAALAQSLFLGNSLPDASDRLGISINTTRTQLRSIFKKVGVHSQAALLQEFAKSVIQG